MSGYFNHASSSLHQSDEFSNYCKQLIYILGDYKTQCFGLRGRDDVAEVANAGFLDTFSLCVPFEIFRNVLFLFKKKSIICFTQQYEVQFRAP